MQHEKGYEAKRERVIDKERNPEENEKHIVERKECIKTNGKNEINNKEFEQKEKADMLMFTW